MTLPSLAEKAGSLQGTKNDSLASLALQNKTFDQMIHEYLLHHCYADTAVAFSQSSASLSASPSLKAEPADRSLLWRKRLFSLVLEGNVREAIQICTTAPLCVLDTSVYPSALPVLFDLKCQEFIELTKTSAEAALTFAHAELGQFSTLDSSYVAILQDIVSLIAYADPQSSPMAEYLSQERRERVAEKLNSHILMCENLSPTTGIEQIVKHITVLHDQLHAETTKDSKMMVDKSSNVWTVSDFMANTSAMANYE
ncbi:CTLH/CRA C-terminal to lish motif domain-containing protein [Polychytrium aggregatum]|uniref:CTLH/CRA C-terminal to lish motif domain-containing protein n=1 Tax=Polychytrium aggregatum TaxID=110093 RepID=UPI0022FF366B|nr:CTLH/CRA C-terminal to lish motif domain-containing protein [Polychytrium aggregatum]KAI9203815.1 CTLH/CRA C-terminal to lish motif domain-containing protein [Polychytrium aggregatum]